MQTRLALRAGVLTFIVAAGVVLIVLALAGCTFVYIRGNGNDITDTGGHGGGVLTEPHPALDELLHGKQPGH